MRILFLASLALLLLTLSASAAPNSAPTLPAHSAPAQGDDVRPPIVTPQMRRYSRTKYALYFFGTAWELLALWGVLASGLSARLGRLVRPLPFSLLRLLAYYALLTLALLVIHAPLTFYGGYWLEHAYGLSAQSLPAWLGDEAKGLGVCVATTVPILWLLFRLMARSPRRWALWFWGALIPIIAFGIFVSPIVVDPILNRFTPLPPGPLKTRIGALAAKAGIPDAPIYVVDKSKQTRETNAYVTGLGPSTRIVLWDTILPPRMPEDQVLAIVGHEMGHYVLHHLLWGSALSVGGLLLVLPLARMFYLWLLARFGRAWGLDGPTDFSAAPALLLVVALFGFLLDPITNGVSRRIEHQADAYGLQVTGNRPAMARAFVSLAEQNLDDPNPPAFIKFWLFTHPPLQERIDFALGKR